MATPEKIVSQAQEAGLWLDEQIDKRFGTPIYIPDPAHNKKTSGEITFRDNDDFALRHLAPVGANRDWLPSQIGAGFLVCFYRQGLKDKLYPGVINSMTSERVLHFTYLDAPINRDEDFAVTPMQELILGGSVILQDERIGTEESHESVEHLASEIGHLAMAVRSLSNPAVMEGRGHKVHDWTAQPGGIIAAMTNGVNGEAPSAFDLPNSVDHVDIKHFGVRPGEADLTLVYSSHFGSLKPKIIKPDKSEEEPTTRKRDEVLVGVIEAEKQEGITESDDPDAVNPALALLGLGVVAARNRLGKRKADTLLLEAIHRL